MLMGGWIFLLPIRLGIFGYTAIFQRRLKLELELIRLSFCIRFGQERESGLVKECRFRLSIGRMMATMMLLSVRRMVS